MRDKSSLAESSSLSHSAISADELNAAAQAYGLTPESALDMERQTGHALTYKIVCAGSPYVVRVRSPLATPEQVLFSRAWALAVSAEVPVPIPLAPVQEVPRIRGRCVDISPYIAHDNTDGHAVSPEAWITVGRWLGQMHRLALPLAAQAPTRLLYGNHPTAERIDQFGSGSIESDSLRLMSGRLVVVMQEQAQAVVMHRVTLRERKRLANKTRQPLTQNVVEAFYVAGLTIAFAAWPMLFLRQHLLVSVPEVREQ